MRERKKDPWPAEMDEKQDHNDSFFIRPLSHVPNWEGEKEKSQPSSFPTQLTSLEKLQVYKEKWFWPLRCLCSS